MDETVIYPPKRCPKCGEEFEASEWCRNCSIRRSRTFTLIALVVAPIVGFGACSAGTRFGDGGIITGGVFAGRLVLIALGMIAAVSIPLILLTAYKNERDFWKWKKK